MAKRLHTFNIDIESEVDEKHYQGAFTCRKAAVIDFSKISKRKSELSGGRYCVIDDDGKPTGQGIDEYSDGLNNLVATLETLLVSAPDWFNVEEIGDNDVMMAIFKEVMAFQNSFRRRRRPEAEAPGADSSSQGNSSSESEAANLDHNAPKVVDRQVPVALDA